MGMYDHFSYENIIIFLRIKYGEGIEAWVNMLEDDDNFIGNNLSYLHKVGARFFVGK